MLIVFADSTNRLHTKNVLNVSFLHVFFKPGRVEEDGFHLVTKIEDNIGIESNTFSSVGIECKKLCDAFKNNEKKAVDARIQALATVLWNALWPPAYFMLVASTKTFARQFHKKRLGVVRRGYFFYVHCGKKRLCVIMIIGVNQNGQKHWRTFET